jgi:acyl-homoserine-lactone acylase
VTETEILWDAWGVPHIFASTDADAFRAFGWAQMRAHGNLFLKLYAQARGRSAEIWGERYLESDKFVRRMGIPARAVDWAAQQTPDMRVNLEAFVTGVNAFAAAHPSELSSDAHAVLPVTLQDVFAHIQRVYAVYLTQGGQRPSSATQNDIVPPTDLLPDVPPLGTGIAGSNAWVIAGQNTASGQPILLANPHLYWADFFTFFEVHLNVGNGDEPSSAQAEEARDANLSLYGVAQVGWPLPRYGFNHHAGWGHTVNALKGWDAFALEMDGEKYVLDGVSRAFEIVHEPVNIRQPDGSIRTEMLEIKRSLHGPVIGTQGGKPVAARCVGFQVAPFPHLFTQYWRMAKSRNLAQFQAALQMHQNPMFTVLYADRDGRIAHYCGGFVPRRAGGGWSDWVSTLRGDDSSLIWTEVHGFDELPRVIDPPSGWLQNSNNPPWTTTIPVTLDPNNFPAYLTPRQITPREQRSIRMISSLKNTVLEDVVACAGSTRSETADRLLPHLLEAARAFGSDLAQHAADVLKRWDRCYDPDSVGADLFARWLLAMRPADRTLSNIWERVWDESDPMNTPHGIRSPRDAVNALEIAATSLIRDAGTLERRWGDFTHVRRGDFQDEAHGHLDPFGVFRVSGYAPDQSGRYNIAFGTTYVAAILFTNPVRAKVLLSYGNSSQPGSKHDGDQIPLFSGRTMRDAWLTRPEIEANLEFLERL